MTLSIIGTPGAANAASITLPTHAVGDLIVIFAYRSNSTTLPTKPTAGGTVPAWVDIDAPAGSNSCSGRSAQFVATATNHTSGTWTNATSMAVIVIRGQDPSLIGGHALSGGSSANQAVAPAITLTETNGTSMILEFYGQGSAGFQNNDWDAAPAGYTRRAATTQSFGPTRSCLNTKDVTTTDGAVNQTGSTNGFASNYQCATIEILDLIPPISFRYFFKGYGYVEQPAVPFNVENINRADKDIPDNAVGCYVTLIGGGGAGGDAHPSSGSGGGGGGGGGARIDRIYIPVASLGSTYSVNRGFGSTVVSAGGSASTFTSGSISLSAGGGGGGTTPGVAGASTGGAGGTASIAGVYATGYSGTAGGGDTYSANGQPGTDNTTNAGAGGGAGGSYAASWYTGGDGGDSSNATGAAGGTSGVHDGATPSSAGAGNGGAGGGGGVGALNTVDTGGGGAGGLYGGGGGGGGGGFNGNPNSFGFGGDGYSLVEWVDAGGAPQILSDDFNRSSLGANWTTRNGTLAMYNTDEVYPSVAGYGVATHVTTMDSDDMHVSVNIGTRAGNGGFAGVILGANSSGSEFVVLAISGTGINTASIYTCTQWDLSGGYTFRATNTISHDTGDNVGLKRVGNVYTVTMNGENTNITWTDSGDIVPRDSSHRHVGFFSDNNGDYWRFDDWEAIDLQ